MANVIACIDGTSVSTSVSDYAAWASLQMAAPLLLLHVLDKSEYPVASNLSGNIGLGSREALLQELAELDEKRGRLALEQGRLMLDAAANQAKADGIVESEKLQRHGNLVDTLIEMESSIRLLVLGKHDEHLGEHIGSRLETVVRTLDRPILVCPPGFKKPENLMIAFDGSATTCKAVEMVAGSPLFLGSHCHVVMVGEESKQNHGQLEWARHTLEAAGFNVTTVLQQGEVETTLCSYRRAQEIDLLVMGAYGHSEIRRFLVGSTTTSVIRNAPVPVLLLR